MRRYLLVVFLFNCLILVGCNEQSVQNSTDKTIENTNSENSSETNSEKPSKPIIDDEGFTLLSLDNFDIFQGKQKKGAPKIKTPTWSEKDGLILCTGQPRGYLYSKKKYRNFIFEIDIRYPETDKKTEELENSNTGVLVYIKGEHRLWPICLEVQGKQKEMGHIKANGKGDVIDADKVKDNQEARKLSIKKVGEWNHLKIDSKEGKLTSFLNGTKICENESGELKEGWIGLQSERNPIEFKNIRIREE